MPSPSGPDPNLSRSGPCTPAPGTHLPPGTCWPPWPFPPPPPAAQRGPGGSRGQGSARGKAPNSGLALRGSLTGARAAGTSAASAVAVHPGPRCRRRSYRLTPGTLRLAPVRSASSGTSSAPARREPGCSYPHPRRVLLVVGLCRPQGRLARPASGFASFRNTFGRSGEQGPLLGSGRRARPRRSATSGRSSAPVGQPLGYFRYSSAPPTPFSEGGRGVGLNSVLAGALQLLLPPRRLARLSVSPGYLQAALPVICINGLRSLALSARLFSFVPTPQGPGGTQQRPTKAPGGDFGSGLLPLSRQRESRPRLGLPGSTSGSKQCVQGRRSRPPGKCAVGNVSKSVEERVGPWSWGIRAGQSGAGPRRQASRSHQQLSNVEGGGGGEGGGSRGRGRRRPRAPSAQHSPLEDAGVLAAQRYEVRVVVREPDAGHVAAVAPVHAARRLGGREELQWRRSPRAHPSHPGGPRGLTLARAHGYWNRCTLQKSSATATTRSLWERHRELMSVPSEPSGHTPSTVAGLSPTSYPPPPTTQSYTVSGAPAAAATHCRVPGKPSRSQGPEGPPGLDLQVSGLSPNDTRPAFPAQTGLHLVPHPSSRVPRPCSP